MSKSKYHGAFGRLQRVMQRLKWPLKHTGQRSQGSEKARDELAEPYPEAPVKDRKSQYRLPESTPAAQAESLNPENVQSGLSESTLAIRASSVNPENMVWVFCTIRSGSSWLCSMMEEFRDHKLWEEPGIGRLFGSFYRRAQTRRLNSTSFILGNPTRKGWIRSIRNFIMDGAHYACPFLSSKHYLIVKETDSSAGAPLIMEALPESRMIFLIRDPRDVAASILDATRNGSWMYEVMDKAGWKGETLTDRKLENFIRRRFNSYLQQIGSIKEAYHAHEGRKVLVRYEDLRANTLEMLKRICSALEIPVGEEELSQAVEKHSWENIPEKEKGKGKFFRKATPGGWKEDLTPDQAKIVESIMAPILKEFYP